MRQPEIVMPEVRNDPALRLGQPGVVRSALMPRVVRKIDPADARIADRRDDVRGIICAAVTHDEQLEVAEGLAQHAADRVRQYGAPVVGRDDDGDTWGHCGDSTLAGSTNAPPERYVLKAMDPKLIVRSDSNVLGGTPVFVGTRVRVQALLDYLE